MTTKIFFSFRPAMVFSERDAKKTFFLIVSDSEHFRHLFFLRLGTGVYF
jgi:hypothetical protein